MIAKVGIVILNFNSSSFLKWCLSSIIKAQTNILFEVGVIDNNSEKKDLIQAQSYFEEFKSNGGRGFFIESDKNLGFSGGNNVVIKRFLEDKSITHVCLLNSDVIVTDYWLDYLLKDNYDVVGPVTNNTGNEQTVAIDYCVKPDEKAFKTANEFSYYRHKAFDGCHVETDILYYFNTIFARRVIEKIGLLDERFYPGSFEDLDYCLRVKNAGFKQIVVRDCFVHHFGSGSFSKLDMPDRVKISNVNKQRFEEKWNTRWEGDNWKILQSCRQDIGNFKSSEMDERSYSLICESVVAAETLIKNWYKGIEWYQSDDYSQSIINQYLALQNDKVNEKNASDSNNVNANTSIEHFSNNFVSLSSVRGKDLLYLLLKKVQLKLFKRFCLKKYEENRNKVFKFQGQEAPTMPLDILSGWEIANRCKKLLLIKLGVKQKQKQISTHLNPPYNKSDFLSAYIKESKVLSEICDKLSKSALKVSIQAPVFTEENERDGYIQRIKRIDEVIFKKYIRIYFFEDRKHKDKICANKISDNLYYITYNSHDEIQRGVVFMITQMCGLMYIHSINRFMTDSVDVNMCQLLNDEKIKVVWDVHGAVPEEYLMYGSSQGKKIADEVESFFYQNSDVIVVVNNAMKEHLMNKHGETTAEFVVLPIFNVDMTEKCLLEEKNVNRTKTEIVYAGGTQKWQNIELMQSIIQNTKGDYHFKIFVPDPNEFKSSWIKKVKNNVIVDSKSPEELADEYKHCHYGFVLRDVDVVNFVACPTKIIEYIKYGIVPIFKTSEIGDFVKLGMKYVNYQDCIDGTLPEETERIEMAKNNLSILNKLQQTYESGIKELVDIINR